MNRLFGSSHHLPARLVITVKNCCLSRQSIAGDVPSMFSKISLSTRCNFKATVSGAQLAVVITEQYGMFEYDARKQSPNFSAKPCVPHILPLGPFTQART